jgi:hypothetical protein
MNKSLFYTLSCIMVLCLGISCASPVHVEEGAPINFAHYKTWQWVESRDSKNERRNASAFSDQAVHTTVQEALSKKGLREVTSDAGLLVTHEIEVENSNERKSETLYSQPNHTYYNPRSGRGANLHSSVLTTRTKSYNVRVREGVLTITLFDPKTNKPVWQAWTTEKMDNSKLTSEEVQKATRRILKKL